MNAGDRVVIACRRCQATRIDITGMCTDADCPDHVCMACKKAEEWGDE